MCHISLESTEKRNKLYFIDKKIIINKSTAITNILTITYTAETWMSNPNNTVITNVFYLNIRFCDFCLICQASYIKCIVICTSVSSIKILNFSISLYYDKNGLNTKHSGLSHLSIPGNNRKRRCISPSTRFNLHVSHNRSLAGTL